MPHPRIDAHQHFWRYDPAEYGWIDDSMAALRRDFLPADAAREMRRAGFDACIAVQARQTLEETRWLLGARRPHRSSPASSAGSICRRRTSMRSSRRLPPIRELVGVRHIVQAEPDGFLLGPAFGRGIALLEQFGLAYDILVYARQLPAAAEFAAAFPAGALRARSSRRSRTFEPASSTSGRRDLRKLAALPNVCRQAVGPGDGGGLAAGRRPRCGRTSTSRSMFRRRPADDWIGLAGLHGCRRTTRRTMAVVADSSTGGPRRSVTPCSAAPRGGSGTCLG